MIVDAEMGLGMLLDPDDPRGTERAELTATQLLAKATAETELPLPALHMFDSV